MKTIQKLLYILMMFNSFQIICALNLDQSLNSNKLFFDQACAYAAQYNYAQACAQYEKIQPKNSVVWHNLGNCFFAQKQCVQALLCWQRAHLGAGWQQLGQLFDVESKALAALNLPLPAWWHNQLQRVILIIPKLILQLLLLMVLILLLYSCWHGECKKQYLLGLFFIGAVSSVAWYMQNQILKKKRAFVVKDLVIVYAGPEKFFHKISQVQLGTEVELIKNHQSMSQISLQGQRGWVLCEQIETV